MEFKISVLEGTERIDELRVLFATGLGQTSREYWLWRLFADNGVSKPLALIAETPEGHLAGMATVLTLVYGEHKYRVLQHCDWVVDPQYRGKGLVRLMHDAAMKHCQSLGYDFMVATPNENSLPIFRKYRYDDVGGIECWNSRKRLLVGRADMREKTLDGYTYRFTDCCPLEKIPQRDDRQYRTPAYMRWKFDENPDAKYTWLTVYREEQPIAYFVYTLTKGRLRTAVNVYDWDVWTQDTKPMQHAIRLLSKFGNYVSIWGRYHEPERSHMKAAGLKGKSCGTELYMKAFEGHSYPLDLTMTRIDTDY